MQALVTGLGLVGLGLCLGLGLGLGFGLGLGCRGSKVRHYIGAKRRANVDFMTKVLVTPRI